MAEEIAKFRFEWRGADFTWERGRFTGAKEDGIWSAVVSPEGLAWSAQLCFRGGTLAAEGLTPQLALEAARQVWLNEVQREFS